MRFWAASLSCSCLLLAPTLGCAPTEVTGATTVANSAVGALPRESVGLIVLEVRTLRDSERIAEWIEGLAAQIEKEEMVGRLLERFGEQTLLQLERVALAVLPMGDGALGYGILAEGDFDETWMREAIGGRETLTLLEVAERPDLSVSVLPGGNLVFGPAKVLDEIRANAASRGAGLDANETLLSLLRHVRSTAQVWGAVDYAPMASLAQRAAEGRGINELSLTAKVGGSLVAIAFQGALEKDFEFDLLGQTTAEEDAKQLADAARGLIALGRMGANRDETIHWRQLLEGLSIDQSGTEVMVHGSIPDQAMSALTESLPSTGF